MLSIQRTLFAAATLAVTAYVAVATMPATPALVVAMG